MSPMCKICKISGYPVQSKCKRHEAQIPNSGSCRINMKRRSSKALLPQRKTYQVHFTCQVGESQAFLHKNNPLVSGKCTDFPIPGGVCFLKWKFLCRVVKHSAAHFVKDVSFQVVLLHSLCSPAYCRKDGSCSFAPAGTPDFFHKFLNRLVHTCLLNYLRSFCRQRGKRR